jgi:hypothetical protein
VTGGEGELAGRLVPVVGHYLPIDHIDALRMLSEGAAQHSAAGLPFHAKG